MKVAAAAAPPALVPFSRWQKARDRATAAILAGERRLLVTGPAGTGKTLLLEHVARTLRAAGWEAAVRLADTDPQPPHDACAALLVDEADRLPREALQSLLLSASGPIVLAGLETLSPRLPTATRITLTTLDREEARGYIAQWLSLTGRTPAHLATAAMHRLVELSTGVPRLLSTLLAASAWLAETEGAPVISLQHVNDAAALRSCLGEWEDEPGWAATTGAEEIAAESTARARRVPGYVAAAMAMLVLGGGGFLTARIWPSEAQQAVQLAQTYIAQLAAQSGVRVAGEPALSIAPVPSAAAPMEQPTPPIPVATRSELASSAAAELPATSPAALADAPAGPTSASPVGTPEPNLPVQTATVPAAEPPTPTPEMIAQEPVVPAEPSPAPPEPAASTRSAPADVKEQAAAAPPAPAITARAPSLPRAELPPSLVEMLLKRGHEMLAVGDVSAARLLFGRAAEAGNVEAMLAMGRTFDPVALAGSSGLLTPDPAEAARWYGRAAAASGTQPAALLDRIGPQAAR